MAARATSWTSDRMILDTFDLQVTPILPIKFRLNWPSIQEKKFKIAFQDDNCGSHLVSPIGMILAIFDLQVTSTILNKFQVNWPFGSGEEAKNRFSRWSHGGHLGFPIGTILAFLIYQLPLCFLQSSSQLAFRFRRRSNKYSRRLPWWPSWISDQKNFSYFLSTNHPKAS